MTLIKLKNVEFNPLTHVYKIDNSKELSGITSILHKYLFKDMYANVSESVLTKAAEHGSSIHEEIQGMIEGFEPANPEPETVAFKALNLSILESEYLVSDCKYVASCIDLVDKDFNLYDIKTTSVLHKEYLSWQLSIYAYLFELQNPDVKVGKLYAIHLRGDKAKVVEVKRLPDSYVVSLIEAFASNASDFSNPLMAISTDDDTMLSKAIEVETAIIDLKAEIERYDAIKKELNDKLMALMDERGITKWETDRLTITRKADSTRTSVDSAKLKESYPDIYKECEKVTNVKGSIIIKIK